MFVVQTMSNITVEQVHAKAKAFVDALGKMPRSQYAITPRGHFARDYNTLRKLAIELPHEIEDVLLGRYITVRTLPTGEEVCEASFVELETYARQIMEQLQLLLPESAAEPAPQHAAESRNRPRPTQAGKPWSGEEDQQLMQGYDAGISVAELATKHQRTAFAIQSRLVRLGKISLDALRRDEPGA